MAGPSKEGEDIVCSAWQHAAGYNPGCKVATCIEHTGNTLQSRAGNQLPFTSINYGTCTLLEGRMITKAILEVSIEGLGKLHRTSIFPCGIFQYMRGVNDKPGTPNYDLKRLALESTAKRLYPNYANADWTTDVEGRQLDVAHKRKVLSELSPEEMSRLYKWVSENPETAHEFKMIIKGGEVAIDENKILDVEIMSTMGCRTYNGYDINFNFRDVIDAIIGDKPLSNSELMKLQRSGNQKDGRGNACPVTIILPTLAMEAGGSVDKFMALLEKKIEEAKDQLIERWEYMCSQDASAAAFMYNNNTAIGYKPEEGIRSSLKHFTLAIGQLGLAEALQILVGCDHTEPAGMELAHRIESLFARKCKEYKETLKMNTALYNTPAETLAYTAMNKFKEKYGIIPKVSDREYFTNSIHVPVWHEMSPFRKIDIEAELVGYSSAGAITYCELDGSVKHNLDALEQIVDYAMEKDIPYFAVNVPNDACRKCGFTGEIENACPVCGSSDIQRLRRVTGYLTNDYKTSFNKGKQAEVNDRVKHGKGTL